MRRIAIAFTLAGALAAAAACGGTATGLATGGSGSVTITVGTGTTPTITWTGGGARRLSVSTTGGSVHWNIDATNTGTGFSSNVTFGVVPAEARESVPDVALVGGTEYRVNVTLVDGSEGTKAFRP